MALRCQNRRSWWRVVGLAVVLASAGYAEGATLVHERAAGGVVTYAYEQDSGGPMLSGLRKDALGVMTNKCPSGDAILRESETRGYSLVSATTEGRGEVTTHRRWGLQFQCNAG